MSVNVIQDYGTTVSPEVYIAALQGHQYIPQSDQCIKNIIRLYEESYGGIKNILDVGCGPGRLTLDIARQFPQTSVRGVDISPSFIDYALMKRSAEFDLNLEYVCQDFCVNDSRIIDEKYDIILMQGVMHHIHGDDRGIFKLWCRNLLKPDGILIVSDEFIRPYKNEMERRFNVAGFYMHIIAEALKGGFEELADEETKNLIDDILSGEKGCGFADISLMSQVQGVAQTVNDTLYAGLEASLDLGMQGSPFATVVISDAITHIRKRAEILADKKGVESFNRGDYKISTEQFIKEMTYEGLQLRNQYEIGPVQQLGGVGVLVFHISK